MERNQFRKTKLLSLRVHAIFKMNQHPGIIIRGGKSSEKWSSDSYELSVRSIIPSSVRDDIRKLESEGRREGHSRESIYNTTGDTALESAFHVHGSGDAISSSGYHKIELCDLVKASKAFSQACGFRRARFSKLLRATELP